MKINQYLSRSTGMSRREAEKEVKGGKVTLNGKVAEFWQEVDSKKDKVFYKKKQVLLSESQTTVILNKPKGYITARKDPKGRKTVMDLLPKNLQNLKPIGRLDYNSEGLLILTDAGQKIFELTHPKFEKEKEYVLYLKNPIDAKLLRLFARGIRLKEGMAKADRLKKLGSHELGVVLHQGYNRQLRRMTEACGNRVTRLVRVRMGDIRLGDLRCGKHKSIKI